MILHNVKLFLALGGLSLYRVWQYAILITMGVPLHVCFSKLCDNMRRMKSQHLPELIVFVNFFNTVKPA